MRPIISIVQFLAEFSPAVDSDLYDFVRSTLLHPQDTTLRSAQDRFWARATFTLARKGEEPNSASAAAKVLTSLSASKPDPSSSAAQPDPSEPDLPVASTSKAKSKAKVKTPKGSRRPGRPPVSETATALVDKDGQPLNESQVVLIHDGLPVVKAEEIYELLVRCHAKVEHGGREKTFKEVKAKWSWVPKGASYSLSFDHSKLTPLSLFPLPLLQISPPASSRSARPAAPTRRPAQNGATSLFRAPKRRRRSRVARRRLRQGPARSRRGSERHPHQKGRRLRESGR